jgi:hypothetical protein
MASNSQSSCLTFPNAGIIDMCHTFPSAGIIDMCHNTQFQLLIFKERKKAAGILIDPAMNLKIICGSPAILTTLISMIHYHDMSFHLFP